MTWAIITLGIYLGVILWGHSMAKVRAQHLVDRIRRTW